MEQFLEKSQNSRGITWTRVKRSNGKYGYVRTKNGRPVDFDEYTGKFKMYDLPDTNSNWTEASKAGASYGKIESIERRPDSHADYVAQQKMVDAQDEAHDLTPIFANLMTAGQAPVVNEGAENIKKGNYLLGASLIASPLMFGSGAVGTAARSGVGLYNLANENGVRKTINNFSEGNYGQGALSLMGDVFNGAMAAEGVYSAFPYLNSAANRSIEALGRNGFKPARTYLLSKEMRNIKTPRTKVSPTIEYSYVPTKENNISAPLKFFERPQSKISEAERLGIPKDERNFKPKWHVANYPGYLLKGLMKGSLLERLLSKNGTININLLNAYFNKASQIEREVANKVLAEKFAGQKTIDYNLFKKAVLDELIGKYNRVPLTEWADYGIENLGYNLKTVGENELPGLPNLIILGLPVRYTPPGTTADPINLSTFTFESPRIPYGNTKHYGGNPIGHSRTYTLPEDPYTLYVMESQSDWGLTKLGNNSASYVGTTEYLNDPTAYRKFIDGHKRLLAKMLENPSDYLTGAIERQIANIEHHEAVLKLMLGQGELNPLVKYLHDNYLQRQLQENLRYAAENGLTRMRYPTSETAAKIEGYEKLPWAIDELGNTINPNDFWNFERAAQNPEAPFETLFDFPKGRGGFRYTPEHQTILKKYADFPKLFLKLFKDLRVRTVTDAKGNTWYEVDVPKGYLSREWLFKQGGKMNIIELFKKGNKIYIKPKNRGKFTKYCHGKVTDECIRRAKASGNPTLVKRATFAANARHFKHKSGGKAFVDNVNVLDSNPRMYKYLTKIKVSPRGVVKKETGGSFVNNALNFINSDTGQSIIGGVFNTIQGMSAKKKLNKAIDSQKKAIDELYNAAKNNIDMGAINSLAQANLELRKALSPGIHFGEIDLGYERNKLKLEALAKAANDANALRDQALANLNNQASLMSNEASNNIIGNIGGLLNGAFQLAGNYFSNKTSNNSTTVKPGYTYSKITSNDFSVPKTNFSVNMKL